MNKLPVILPYVKDGNFGNELKRSLRSLKNIKNFSGEVVIMGDKEDWFTNINYRKVRRRHGRPYVDQKMKMLLACELYPAFIASQDDIYVTEPLEITAYYKGDLQAENSNFYQRSKKATKEFLESKGLPIKDFDVHAPLVVQSYKLKETLKLILNDPLIQWRSVYGNTWGIEAELFADAKTKTTELIQGKIISTQYFTDELDKLFPEKSIYEL